jgi:hypothetical protein
MSSIQTSNKLRFRTHFSLVKGHAASNKDSTIVRLQDGKWLCVRSNGQTGRFGVYENIEQWVKELPRNDGVICLTDDATRVERMKPGSGKTPPKNQNQNPVSISDEDITANIQRIMAMADTCITTSGRVRYITELMRYLVSVPNYVRNHPVFREAVMNKCDEYMESDEFSENVDFHHAVYEVYTAFT